MERDAGEAARHTRTRPRDAACRRSRDEVAARDTAERCTRRCREQVDTRDELDTRHELDTRDEDDTRNEVDRVDAREELDTRDEAGTRDELDTHHEPNSRHKLDPREGFGHERLHAVISLSTNVAFLRRFAAEISMQGARPDVSMYSDEDRDAARFAWATRIFDEYRSVAVFSELLRLMSDLEASFPAQCAVHRMIGDELRHTQVTAQVVDWLGGFDGLSIDLSDASLPPREERIAVRAMWIVGRELVVAEQESVYALAAYRNATTEPAIRSVLDAILVDEVRHAAAGKALFSELVHLLDTDEQATLRTVMDADREALRAEYRTSAVGGAGRALGGCIELPDLESIWRRAA